MLIRPLPTLLSSVGELISYSLTRPLSRPPLEWETLIIPHRVSSTLPPTTSTTQLLLIRVRHLGYPLRTLSVIIIVVPEGVKVRLLLGFPSHLGPGTLWYSSLSCRP